MAAIPLLLATGSFYYREQYLHYLSCLGRYLTHSHFFCLLAGSHSPHRSNDYYMAAAAGGFHLHFLLPVYHPFHFFSIFFFLTYMLIVPVGYYKIYARVNRTTEASSGLNERLTFLFSYGSQGALNDFSQCAHMERNVLVYF